MTDLLSNNEDLEILGSIDSGSKAGAFLHYFLVKMTQFLLLTMVFLFGVEDGGDLYWFCRTRVSKFDVKSSPCEIRSVYRAFIIKSRLFVLADIVLQHAGMKGTRRFVFIENIGWDRDYFEYFIFIGGYFDLELHILTESDVCNLIFTLMDCLQYKRICSTVLSLDDHDDRVIH